MKVLLTGSSGFLGKKLTRLLSDNGLELMKFRNFNHFDDTLRATIGIDTVVHLAAMLNYRNANRDEMMEINYSGSINLIEASLQNGVKNFIFASTQDIYAGASLTGVCKNENDAIDTDKLSNYALSKYLVEKELRKHQEACRDINITICRIAVIYGKNMHNSLLTDMIEQGKTHRMITVYGAGERIYDLIHADDVADCMLKLIGKKGTYNIGCGEQLRVKEIAGFLSRNLNCKIAFDRARDESQGYYLSISKTKRAIDFRPIPFEKGVSGLLWQ